MWSKTSGETMQSLNRSACRCAHAGVIFSPPYNGILIRDAAWKPRNPLRGAPTAGNKGSAMLSCLPTAGRGIRTNCGASCPFGSLDRGACGLVVGDDTALGPQGGVDPGGKTASACHSPTR